MNVTTFFVDPAPFSFFRVRVMMKARAGTSRGGVYPRLSQGACPANSRRARAIQPANAV